MSQLAATILIVDDSDGSREGLAQLLREDGYRALTASDGEEAAAAVAAESIDLVLLDVSMPGMTGLELLDALRRAHTAIELPVIMVTASNASDTIVRALEQGANDYVTKPIDLPVLMARMRTQLELRRLSRLKDEFLRVASHDLKNPLTAILCAGDALAESFPIGTPMNDEGRWYIDSVTRRAQQMRGIITAFLDLGALQDGRLQLQLAAVDIGALAARAVEDNLGYARGKSIALTLDAAAASLPAARADAGRIAQVIDNLVGNAIKFSPRGAAVVVSASAGQGGPRLEVRDSGPGIPAADLPRLFERHARLGNRPTGGESSTGLGLALCKQLIALHAGRIGASNRDGGGATFWFELPPG